MSEWEGGRTSWIKKKIQVFKDSFLRSFFPETGLLDKVVLQKLILSMGLRPSFQPGLLDEPPRSGIIHT